MKPRKKKIINLILIIIVIMTEELTAAQESSKLSRDAFYVIKERPKIREPNFRPPLLSTPGVGFGKRADRPYVIIKNSKGQPINILSPLQDITWRMPIYWLQRHVRRYAESIDDDITRNRIKLSDRIPDNLTNPPLKSPQFAVYYS